MAKKQNKQKNECSLDMVLENLDGCGLIITDTDLIKACLEEMGFTYDSKTVVTKE